jgi:2-phosphosulfolactate phosphatase
MTRVQVLLAPGPVPRGSAALILDVLRATTTLTTAFANGAARVIPAATLEEARARKREHPDALMCGERDGRIVPGFDLGNSPEEYGRERVAGRTLVFASTNGSVAMQRAAGARRRILAAFVNASAALDAVRGEERVAIVCSGKLGSLSLEDTACAGWLAARLAERGARIEGAAARLALALAPGDPEAVRALVQGASHGRYLRALGGFFARDVEAAATLDTHGAAYEL